MDEETWRPVNFMYRVSSLGRVHSDNPQGRCVSPIMRENGKMYVSIPNFGNSTRYPHRLEQLVAEAFLEEVEDPWHRPIIHLDGDQQNCRADNLAWKHDEEE